LHDYTNQYNKIRSNYKTSTTHVLVIETHFMKVISLARNLIVHFITPLMHAITKYLAEVLQEKT